MREFSTPPTTEVPEARALSDDLRDRARETPDAVLFSRPTPAGDAPVTAAQFHGEVRALAKGLVASGIEPGARVGIMSRTRYEWALFDYAVWYVGGVTVPVYETSPADLAVRILRDSGAVALLVEHTSLLAAVNDARQAEDLLAHVWSLDAGAVDVLTRLGADLPDADLDDRSRAMDARSLATLIYTSGTTGTPKGCMLTHGNLLAEVGEATAALPELFARDDARTVLMLPLAHIFARVIHVGCVRAGVQVRHVPALADLAAALAECQPTFLLAVPRVLERMFTAASQHAAADGQGRVFHRAVETAIAWSQALDHGRPGPTLRARHALYQRLVYRRFRATLGDRCEYAVCGGAPLGERLGHFYRGAGIPVLEGYGLTETTAAAAVNRPGSVRIGTVGQPLGGTAVRIGEDGELLVRGPQVMTGYWNDPDATRSVLRDGWLRTGDLGEIDEEGFIRVTGRIKEILVTAGGKNVAPAVLEERIRAHPLVGQCLVVGDGRPFIAALLTLDHDATRAWARRLGKPPEIADLVEDPDLRREIQGAVDEANAAVSQAEAVRRFLLLDDEWTEEGGHLTPSLKLRRGAVTRQVRLELDRLYSG